MIVADANILLRLLEPRHPHCTAALDAISHFISIGEEFCTLPHCLHEVYHVLTRVQNGHGKSPAASVHEIKELMTFFPLRHDTASLFDVWLDLVQRHEIAGRLAYDAKIVAAMKTHGLRSLLTFNDVDFGRFPEIQALNPFDVLQRPRV